MLHKFETYLLGLQVHEQAEHVLNTSWTLVSANECQWVSRNSLWTPIECAWMPLSEYEHAWIVHKCHWVIIEIEHNSPWCDNEKDLICVRTDHTLNACECMWMPLSEFWTSPDHLWVCLNTFEWDWTHPECLLVSMNASEWVGTSPEHPLSDP
jgi:hypothetical protein